MTPRKAIWLVAMTLVLAGLATIKVTLLLHERDEPLRPETRAALARPAPTSANGLAAFYYLLGLRLGERRDPEAQGRLFWAEAENRRGDRQASFLKEKLGRGGPVWSYPQSVPPGDHAPSDIWRRQAEARLALEESLPLLKHYDRLVEFGDFSPPDFRGPVSPSSGDAASWLNGHYLFALDFGRKIATGRAREAQARLRSENRFYRAQLGKSSLLNTLLALLALDQNAGWLEQEAALGLRPEPATLDSFALPPADEIYRRALEREFHAGGKMLNAVPGLSGPPEARSWYERRWKNSAYNPNATLNLYFSTLQSLAEGSCRPEDFCAHLRDWRHEEWPWPFVRNPGGKGLVAILAGGLAERRKALDARVRHIEETVARLR